MAFRRLLPDDVIASGNLGEPMSRIDDTPTGQVDAFAYASPCEGWGLSVDGESLEDGATNVWFGQCGGQSQCDSRFTPAFCRYVEVAPYDDPDYAGGETIYSRRPFVNATHSIIVQNSTDGDDPTTTDKLLISQDWHPSDFCEDLYVNDVTITNLWDRNITHVKYRKTADFDGK